MRITFLGGAGTVTGSKSLIDLGDTRLLVDCGLFQGLKDLRLQNWSDPPFDPSAIDGVLLTHAHLDHAGWLPALVRHGYRGPVWCTTGTASLLRILLLDAAHIQEEDAEAANRLGYSKHTPALPLFDRRDAEAALGLVRPIRYGETFRPASEIEATFRRAGHIVGAARIELERAGRRLIFSGDVGRAGEPLLLPPDPLGSADWIVVESTYGDRLHEPGDPLDRLERAIRPVLDRGGVVLAPCFAVGRAQTLLHLLARLRAEGRIPEVPVYLDSPMAIEATKIYCEHVEDHRLTHPECKALCALPKRLRTAAESRRLNRRRGPFIVLAGSGMATGGRILHHLEHRGGDANNAILLAGFQAAGTRGRALADGARELKMHGRIFPIRAEILNLSGLSGHADRQGLLDWLNTATAAPRHLFINHGEPAAAEALTQAVRARLGWEVSVVRAGQTVTLEEP